MKQTIGNTRRDAEEAVAELAAALRSTGLTLPSLQVDHVSTFNDVVLVSLGRARPDVVHSLAEVIRKGAAA